MGKPKQVLGFSSGLATGMLLRHRQKNLELNHREIELERSVLESTPLYLKIDPTNRCNCRCIMCYRSFTSFPLGDLETTVFNKIRPILSKARWAYFSGTGEPFLNKSLSYFLKSARTAGARTSLSTNGTVLDLDAVRHLTDINFSLDAASKELFERIRLGASFEGVKQNIQRVVSLSRRPYVRLYVTVGKYNLSQLAEIIDLAKELSVDEVFYARCYSQSDLMRHLVLDSSDYEAMKKVEDEVARAARQDVKYVFSFSHKELIGSHSHENVETSEGTDAIDSTSDSRGAASKGVYCVAPFNMFYLEWNGRVRQCCIYPETLGSLSDGSFGEMWNSKAYQELRGRMLSGAPPQFCLKCNDPKKHRDVLMRPKLNFPKQADRILKTVTLSWKSVQYATHYEVHVTRVADMSILRHETVDTWFTIPTDFVQKRSTYYWTVFPKARTRTGPRTPIRFFTNYTSRYGSIFETMKGFCRVAYCNMYQRFRERLDTS